MKLKSRLKGYESLYLFETKILPKIKDEVLDINIEKNYYAVIDTTKEGKPLDGYGAALNEKSNNEKQNAHMFDNFLAVLPEKTAKTMPLFYNNVDIIYDYEFNGKIEKL